MQSSLSGGSRNTQFLISAGYRKESTVFPEDFSYQKGSVHFSLNHISGNKKFAILFSGSYLGDKNKLPSTDPTITALYLPPDAPSVFTSSGKLNWENSEWTNPYGYFLQLYKINTQNLLANSTISYKILPSLDIKTSLGFNNIRLDEINTYPVTAFDPAFAAYGLTASAYFANSALNSFIAEPQLNWKYKSGIHSLDILVGTSFQQRKEKAETYAASGFPNDQLVENIQAASSVSIRNATSTDYRYFAVLGRINYSLNARYLINITARRDGSSRFGPGNRFANFGAVGVGWLFSKEKFIREKLSFLSFGKLRASYGIIGNDQIGDYQYLDTWSPGPFTYQSATVLNPNRLLNTGYSWETNKKGEIALQLGFMGDRLLATVIYYQNRSGNQLVGFPLPQLTGFSSIQANLPAIVENKGWEFEFNTVNIKGKNFSWTSAFNLSIPSNRLVSYPGIEKSSYIYKYKVGQSLFIQQRYRYTGVDETTGVYNFEDVDKDGKISSPNDLQARKKLTQSFFGGFQNAIQFKGFELDIFFQFVKQTGYNYILYQSAPGFMSNQPDNVLSRWQNPGDRSAVEKFTQDYGSAAYRAYSNSAFYADNSISDASFLRLKNLSLSWQLPDKWKKPLHLQFCKLYFQAQNLVTITNYLGLDPETQNFTYLPTLRILSTGIQFTF